MAEEIFTILKFASVIMAIIGLALIIAEHRNETHED